jgi:hypothetical protein
MPIEIFVFRRANGEFKQDQPQDIYHLRSPLLRSHGVDFCAPINRRQIEWSYIADTTECPEDIHEELETRRSGLAPSSTN